MNLEHLMQRGLRRVFGNKSALVQIAIKNVAYLLMVGFVIHAGWDLYAIIFH